MNSVFIPGSFLGRYRLEEQIGQGGMGVVYRASDPTLHRPVAIKLLAPHLVGDENARARFLREAASAARLKHPNIATVYEFGEHAGQPFIAAEWIEGRTLTALIEIEKQLPLDRALRLFDQLASAIDYAHAQGVIHRDIKPGNMIVGLDDHVTIVDFGLAWMAAGPAITSTETMIGTPRYMSPEQINGKPVDARSDLYNLAIVFYEMLAGRPPFDNPSPPAVLHSHLYATPPPISEFHPSLPASVEIALTRALAKDPAARFETASAFGAALRGAASTPISRAARPQRRWILVALVAALLMVCALSALGSTQLMRIAAAVTPTRVVAVTTPSPAPSATILALPTAAVTPSITVTNALTVPIEGGAWTMRAGDAAQSGYFAPELGRLKPAPRWTHDPQSKPTTGLVIADDLVVFGMDGGKARALDWATGEVTWETPLGANIIGAPAIFVDENNALVCFATDDRELHALNLDDGKLVWRKAGAELRGAVVGITPGVDGMIYAAVDAGWLHAIDPGTGKINWSLDLSKTDHLTAPPTLTNVAIFVAGANQAVYALDPTSHTQIWTAKTTGAPATPPMVMPGLGMVFVGTDSGWLHAFSMVTGKPMWAQQVDSKIVGLANDGARIYAATISGSVYAWDIPASAPAWSIKVGSALSAAPLTDGNVVVVVTQAGEVRFIDAETGQEAVDRRLNTGAPITQPPAPAGGWLFVRSSKIFGFAP